MTFTITTPQATKTPQHISIPISTHQKHIPTIT